MTGAHPPGLDSIWASAFREHDAAIASFIESLRRVPVSAWHEPTAPGKWTPAGVALHIVRAYEFGHDALTRGTPMRPRVTPLQAWLLRTFVLPLALATGRFPEGATAPAEVDPDMNESSRMSIEQAVERVQRAADVAAATIASVARTGKQPHISHAYFGRLPALQAFRFVSAHTRHHMRSLNRVFAGRMK